MAIAHLHIGFTGTRHAKYIIADRIKKLKEVLQELFKDNNSRFLHHGGCYGGDVNAHIIGKYLGYKIIRHPPLIKKYMAINIHLIEQNGDRDMSPAAYLERNKHIVNSVSLLIAMPKDISKLEIRSGTWATIRYAKKKKTPIIFV